MNKNRILFDDELAFSAILNCSAGKCQWTDSVQKPSKRYNGWGSISVSEGEILHLFWASPLISLLIYFWIPKVEVSQNCWLILGWQDESKPPPPPNKQLQCGSILLHILFRNKLKGNSHAFVVMWHGIFALSDTTWTLPSASPHWFNITVTYTYAVV